ncbi:MAG: SDR family NAD(P)-dependent oxidoreductase [Deltaproteobacteria bacterium]|nr:SDR family NAD(P)-dependent oxidoreductase [Deltaproteobacteria bacterium]
MVKLTRITLPAQIFHVLGGLLSAVLQARDKHALPAFANLGYSLSIVGFGLVLGPSLGAEGFAWGVLVGSILGPFGMPLYGCLRDGLGWRPLMRLGHPDFRRYVWLSFPIMIAFSIVVVDDWLLKRFGSLVGEGVVSRLQYAKTLMKVPWGIFGMAAGAAAFPTLARLVAEGKGGEAYETLIRACRVMLVLAFASQAAFTVAGEHLAAVIWGTTRFTAEELHQIGLLNAVFCGALGAWAAQSLISRGFYAQQNTWFPSLWGSAVVLLAWPIYGLLGERLGAVGLAIASSLAITVYTVVMSLRLRQTLAGPERADLGGLRAPRCWGSRRWASSAVKRWTKASACGSAPRAWRGRPTSRALVRGALGGGLAMVLCLGLAWVCVNEGRRGRSPRTRRLSPSPRRSSPVPSEEVMNVLITGASRGVGRAIANRLARPGGRVIVNYVRSEEAAQEVAREVEAKGAEALVIQGDVRDPKDLERLAAALPSLDALIHNAAIGVLKPYDKIRTNQWDLHDGVFQCGRSGCSRSSARSASRRAPRSLGSRPWAAAATCPATRRWARRRRRWRRSRGSSPSSWPPRRSASTPFVAGSWTPTRSTTSPTRPSWSRPRRRSRPLGGWARRTTSRRWWSCC